MPGKTLRFTKNGIELCVQRIPAFNTPLEKSKFYQEYWKDEANIKLHEEADFVFEYKVFDSASHKIFLLKEMEWMLVFAAAKGIELHCTFNQTEFMKHLVSGKVIKEAKGLMGNEGSYFDNELAKIKQKAGDDDMSTKNLVILFSPVRE